MINERLGLIWRRMPVVAGQYCGAKWRFSASRLEDADGRDDGIHDRGRRRIADFLLADEPGAEPKRQAKLGCDGSGDGASYESGGGWHASNWFGGDTSSSDNSGASSDSGGGDSSGGGDGGGGGGGADGGD